MKIELQPTGVRTTESNAQTSEGQVSHPSYVPTLTLVVDPPEVAKMRKRHVSELKQAENKLKKSNTQSRYNTAMNALKKLQSLEIEVARLKHQYEGQHDVGQLRIQVDIGKALVAQKDKLIRQQEDRIADLEALSRATKGRLNKELGEEVTNYVKEEVWRVVKFVSDDDEARKVAKIVTKNLKSAKAFHGDMDKEATFYLTYKPCILKGINGRRNYLTQELKKIAWVILDEGKDLYDYPILLKCARRDIDPNVSTHLFCRHAQYHDANLCSVCPRASRTPKSGRPSSGIGRIF